MKKGTKKDECAFSEKIKTAFDLAVTVIVLLETKKMFSLKVLQEDAGRVVLRVAVLCIGGLIFMIAFNMAIDSISDQIDGDDE